MFKLEIQTDNAAFGDTEDEMGAEVARILRLVAERLEQGMIGTPLEVRVRDSNGNKIGTWSLTQ